MTRFRQTLIDLLSMSRFANLPTVWSNVMLGWLVGQAAGIGTGNVRLPLSWRESPLASFSDHFDPWASGLGFPVHLILAASLLYLGGCFLNDWKDRDFDREHRPERAIPAGRFSAGTVFLLAASFLATGLGISLWVSSAALVISLAVTTCVVIYTWWHKTKPFSILFMAGSRAGLYFLGAFGSWSLITFTDYLSFGAVRAAFDAERWEGTGISSPGFEDHYQAYFQIYGLSSYTWLVPLLAFGLGAYILGISLFARFESKKPDPSFRPPAWILALFLIPLVTHPGLLRGLWVPWLPLAVLPFGAAIFWIRRGYQKSRDVGQFVSRALACIPLVDLIAATLIVFSAGEFLIPGYLGNPVLYLFFPACCALAFLFQKAAPAT